MRTTELNHVALHVVDLQASIAFYGGMLQLEPLPRPGFDFDGAWFRIGTHQELHLIADRRHPVNSHSRGTHFAVGVDDFDAWDKYLTQDDVERSEVRHRPDGARQIFLCDPDGHWLELVSTQNVRRGVSPAG